MCSALAIVASNPVASTVNRALLHRGARAKRAKRQNVKPNRSKRCFLGCSALVALSFARARLEAGGSPWTRRTVRVLPEQMNKMLGPGVNSVPLGLVQAATFQISPQMRVEVVSDWAQ